ncbi:MAG: diguanylate cyclase [Planctomycetales bacterium]|nr:diguanylate cyclase [Planctomycetales bacterium]
MEIPQSNAPSVAASDAPVMFGGAESSSLRVLLGNVDEAPNNATMARFHDEIVNRRLGIACSLFRSLRAKHAPTADHCLRVAMRCSIFGTLLQLPESDLQNLEIAALLHDIGKIGVPDSILCKPGSLSEDETDIMNSQWEQALTILSAACFEDDVLQIIRCCQYSFDPPQRVSHPIREALPIGARILKIADAFDAMTTDHVYRRAMPLERAVAELFRFAGSQFDPELVREFANFSAQAEAEVNLRVSDRWLKGMSPEASNSLWQLKEPLFTRHGTGSPESVFQQKLLDAMQDGVVFVDSKLRILVWNRGAERLTGIAPGGVYEKVWDPAILKMRDKDGNLLKEKNCPVRSCIETSGQSLRRVIICPDGREHRPVDVHVIPVCDERGRCHGATMLIHDVSSEASLEERVQDLHEQATTDPLTGVANRAEFDRVHRSMVDNSLASGNFCSIVICDIDRFKSINDEYGHQAGDEALKSFASLLQRSCRQGDLVARYGGEEFVLLYPNCDNAGAVRRAEEIRRELSQTAQLALNGKCMTSSFGVTELQLGDTPETMLRRADRALYQAKDGGRNRVVQLGAGFLQEQYQESQSSWIRWMTTRRNKENSLERTLIANVPVPLLAEKIRGFISDHHAEIIQISEDQVSMHVQTRRASSILGQNDDSPDITLVVELSLREQVQRDDDERRTGSRTLIDVKIRPRRSRDKRVNDSRPHHVLASLRSYLIAQEYHGKT